MPLPSPQLPSKVGCIEGQPDSFCITPRGLGVVAASTRYQLHGALVCFRLNKRPSDFTTLIFFESMLELASQGWVHSRQKPSRKIEAYRANQCKVWYLGEKPPSVHYLHSLLYANDLFHHGLQMIFHFQSAAYYKCLLFFMRHAPSRVSDVKPNQPHSYYKLLRKIKKGPSSSSSIVEGRTLVLEAEPNGINSNLYGMNMNELEHNIITIIHT